MKIVLGALALMLAVPAATQTAPAADPHAAHAAMRGKDHAQMMQKCKDPRASAAMKAHCAAMKKEHAKAAAASTQPKTGHAH